MKEAKEVLMVAKRVMAMVAEISIDRVDSRGVVLIWTFPELSGGIAGYRRLMEEEVRELAMVLPIMPHFERVGQPQSYREGYISIRGRIAWREGEVLQYDDVLDAMRGEGWL